MPNSALRRKKKRRRRLAHLAKTNPDKFNMEWSLRINSWAEEIKQRASKLVDHNGSTVPLSFNVVDDAITELQEIAKIEQLPIIEETIRSTKEVLAGNCCKEIARASDTRLYK